MHTRSRQYVRLGMLVGVFAFVLLIAYSLFIRFPDAVGVGDANLPLWLGADAARVSFMILTLIIEALCLWVVWQGTQASGNAPVWMVGAGVGAVASLVVSILMLITGARATTMAEAQRAFNVMMLLWLIGPLVCGLIASWLTARVSAGAGAGFWFVLVLVVFSSVAILVRDSLFAERLAQTAWVGDRVGDPLCNDVTGRVLLACEVGDDLGGIASEVVMLPLIGLVLGGLAGLVGRVLGRKRKSGVRPREVLAAPLVFSAALIFIFVLEIAFKLW